jgi:peptidoglycan/LPS O-acetylase OafA/YrhL
MDPPVELRRPLFFGKVLTRKYCARSIEQGPRPINLLLTRGKSRRTIIYFRQDMIKSLEGGRGIAALIVALYHLQIGAAYFPVIRNGYLFVDLFLVLSGFVICASYASRMQTPDDFFSFVIRRVGRLLPLLIFSTAFFVLTMNLIILAKKFVIWLDYAHALSHPAALDYLIPSTGEILSTLTMTHGLGIFDRLILNTPSWSISTEFYTYVLFAAVCLLMAGKIRLAFFSALGAIGFLLSVWASVSMHHCLVYGDCLALTYDFGLARSVCSFFVGALTWHASRTLRFDFTVLQVPGLIALALLLSFVNAHPGLAFAFPALFALLILSICNDQGALAEMLKRRPLQVLGRQSYSIYLMQMPLLLLFENIAKRFDGIVPSLIILGAYVATLLAVSAWTCKFIEEPFRLRFNRLATGFGSVKAATS